MVEFEVDSRENSSVDESLVKLKLIQLELREVVANLHEKIEIIESEPLQKIRLDVESKANSLEAEVKRLREDIKAIKDLLGINLEKKKTGDF
jgi:cell shape-determining protein MreC